MLSEGYIQLYTGTGKGKTTAALGLALRASGAGLKTFIIQFMKGNPASEHQALQKISDLITIEQYGSREFYRRDTNKYLEHRGFSSKGLQRAREVLSSGDYSVVILDEIVNALNCDLITFEEIKELIELKAGNCELVLTGSNAPDALIDECDLVTEMKKIKHYYDEKVPARVGIEK